MAACGSSSSGSTAASSSAVSSSKSTADATEVPAASQETSAKEEKDQTTVASSSEDAAESAEGSSEESTASGEVEYDSDVITLPDEPEWQELEKVKSITADDILLASLGTVSEDGYLMYDTEDGSEISRIYTLLCALSLGEESNMTTADDSTYIDLTTPDGVISFSFDGSVTIVTGERYEVENFRELWSYVHTLVFEKNDPDNDGDAHEEPLLSYSCDEYEFQYPESWDISNSGTYTALFYQGQEFPSISFYRAYDLDIEEFIDEALAEAEEAYELTEATFYDGTFTFEEDRTIHRFGYSVMQDEQEIMARGFIEELDDDSCIIIYAFCPLGGDYDDDTLDMMDHVMEVVMESLKAHYDEDEDGASALYAEPINDAGIIELSETDDAEDHESEAMTASAGSTGYKFINYQYGDVFTIIVPQGWYFDVTGSYSSFGFHMWDPDNPDIQFFYYGELGPFFASEYGKNSYISMLGSNSYFAPMPVLDPPTLPYLIYNMNSYSDVFYKVNGYEYTFPVINDLKVKSRTPLDIFTSDWTVDQEVFQASLTSNTGMYCTGVFQGAITKMYTFMYGDTVPNVTALCTSGIIAPNTVYDEVAPLLAQCLCSFRFTDKYINQGLQYMEFVAESSKAYSDYWNAQMDSMLANYSEYLRS